MKSDGLADAMNLIDDELLLSAEKARGGKYRRQRRARTVRFAMSLAAAAVVCVAVAGVRQNLGGGRSSAPAADMASEEAQEAAALADAGTAMEEAAEEERAETTAESTEYAMEAADGDVTAAGAAQAAVEEADEEAPADAAPAETAGTERADTAKLTESGNTAAAAEESSAAKEAAERRTLTVDGETLTYVRAEAAELADHVRFAGAEEKDAWTRLAEAGTEDGLSQLAGEALPQAQGWYRLRGVSENGFLLHREADGAYTLWRLSEEEQNR